MGKGDGGEVPEEWRGAHTSRADREGTETEKRHGTASAIALYSSGSRDPVGCTAS